MSYILDKIPKFCSGSVSINGTTYSLKVIEGNGAIFMTSKGGVPEEEITLSKETLKAIYCLTHAKDL